MNRRAFHKAVLDGGMGLALAGTVSPASIASSRFDGVHEMVERVLDGLPPSPIAFEVFDGFVDHERLVQQMRRLRGDTMLWDPDACLGSETILTIDADGVRSLFFAPDLPMIGRDGSGVLVPTTIWRSMGWGDRSLYCALARGDGRPYHYRSKRRTQG